MVHQENGGSAVSRTVESPFGSGDAPRRIEDDAMFAGWRRRLPRLWYLEQRQAIRLDAESLYGGSQFAVFYSRAQFRTLPTLVHSGEIGQRGYLRTQTRAIPVPEQSVERVLDLERSVIRVLAEPEQESRVQRPTTSPVAPIVHDIGGTHKYLGEPDPEA